MGVGYNIVIATSWPAAKLSVNVKFLKEGMKEK